MPSDGSSDMGILYDDFPARKRWDGDRSTLGYDVVGDPVPTEQITIHYRTWDGPECTASGEFMEFSAHNSWLHVASDGDWYVVRPDGHVSVECDDTPPRTSDDLGVADRVVA